MEWLVVLACLSSQGCNESRDAYIHYNPQVQETVNGIETNAKNKLGEGVIKAGAPLISSAVSKQLVVPLGSVYVKTNFNIYSINFGASF